MKVPQMKTKSMNNIVKRTTMCLIIFKSTSLIMVVVSLKYSFDLLFL